MSFGSRVAGRYLKGISARILPVAIYRTGLSNARALAKRPPGNRFPTMSNFPFLENFIFHHFPFLVSNNLCIYNFYVQTCSEYLYV